MKFTVITINYNNVEGLRATFDSVFSQTCHDYQYVVIDGGSTDGSKELIEQNSDKIDYWVSEKDKGIYNAMNKGVAVATGEYCIFMNSGDCFYDMNVLKKIIAEGCDTDVITGITIGKDENDVWFDTKHPISFLTFYRGTISHQASFIHTSVLKQIPYNEELKIVSDWEFWIKALILTNHSHSFSDVIVARIEPDGISVTNGEQREAERKKVLDELIPERILKDIKVLRYVDDQMVEYIAKISKTYRIRNFVKKGLDLLCKHIK